MTNRHYIQHGLFFPICVRCGAVVMAETVGTHDDWHNFISRTLELLGGSNIKIETALRMAGNQYIDMGVMKPDNDHVTKSE